MILAHRYGGESSKILFWWSCMIFFFSSFAHHAWCSWPEFCGPCLPIHNHQGCICATGIWIWICYPPHYRRQYHHQICASHHWPEQWESLGQQGCISFVHWVGHGWVMSYNTIHIADYFSVLILEHLLGMYWICHFIMCQVAVNCQFSLKLCTDRSPGTLIESDSTICCMYTTASSWRWALEARNM